MKATRQRNTAAEKALHIELTALGLTLEIDRRVLSGSTRRADIIFPDERISVFVDGCFWHGCPIHGTWPKKNADFWRAKIERNRTRDEDTDRRLREEGWTVVRFWEHEDPQIAAQQILETLERARSGG